MHASATPAPNAAAAFAQAIAEILLALLAAWLGDVSDLSPRHPRRRMHARALAEIESLRADLVAALTPKAGAASNPPRRASAPARKPCAAPAITVPTPGARRKTAPPKPRTTRHATAPPNRKSPLKHQLRTPNSLRFRN